MNSSVAIMDKLYQIISSIRTKKGLQPLYEISGDLTLRNDLGFDSLDLAEMTVRIEDEFGVDIFEDGFVRSVGEILEKIR